jgi:hypothetical protein
MAANRLLMRFLNLASSSLAVTIFILFTADVFALASGMQQSTQMNPPDPVIARNYYLNDLFQPHDYVPGKNSYLFQALHRGQTRTVLELAGHGSVRHIWSTWSIPGSDAVPAGRVLLRVFVDKQSRPSIVGTIDELCQAARNTGARFVPFPAFVYKDAYNMYLPIYFTNGIRIEIEPLDEINEFYTQIDYRLTPRMSHPTRLISEHTNAGLVLKYTGIPPLSFDQYTLREPHLIHSSIDLNCGYRTSPCEFTIDGPAILRQLIFRGNLPSDLELSIYWDDDTTASVQAPFQYLFADFANAALTSTLGEMTTYFPMPFRRKATIILRSPSNRLGHITLAYAMEPVPIPENALYFHAIYHDADKTLGYLQYPILQVHGKGLFVGMNLFNSGHNHGGGDSALIDGGTEHPRVLHGICGEDYFGFAWHHTGTMTPLTGAPVHERRYRLHLENPYPFTESFQLLFGMFAGQEPKSVAFWYQAPENPQPPQWVGLDAQWKVLGPLGPDALLPDEVSDKSYKTTVAFDKPTNLTERWQDVQMDAGFLDLTYQFRHYALIEKGSGFVAGASRTQLTTYVYSPSKRTLAAIVGHDDDVRVQLNGEFVADLRTQIGFGPSPLKLTLRSGWNKLDLILSNGENVNWRWSGVSFAIPRGRDRNLRFLATPALSSSPSLSAAKY